MISGTVIWFDGSWLALENGKNAPRDLKPILKFESSLNKLFLQLSTKYPEHLVFTKIKYSKPDVFLDPDPTLKPTAVVTLPFSDELYRPVATGGFSTGEISLIGATSVKFDLRTDPSLELLNLVDYFSEAIPVFYPSYERSANLQILQFITPENAKDAIESFHVLQSTAFSYDSQNGRHYPDMRIFKMYVKNEFIKKCDIRYKALDPNGFTAIEVGFWKRFPLIFDSYSEALK